ncbi:hypothetical protein BH10ACI4_BH10ACI4_00270 [soil metagenome]
MTIIRTTQRRLNLALRLLALLWLPFLWSAAELNLQAQTSTQPPSLALAGLRTAASQGQFNAVQSDPSGNLYLLLDQHDGIRLLKTDPTAASILAEAHLGGKGDTGVALALDPTGNLYVTGTSTSGTLSGTSGTVYPTAPGSAVSFVAKFDAALNSQWLTFTGSDRMAATAIAANDSGVFVTGSIFSATLPVTTSAILQTPSYGSLQNGFVEKFDPAGTTLLYATYLTGASGDTAPTAIAADSSGNAYIVGYTTAPGYPTLNALVPNIIPNITGATSGFLTKLTPTADGLAFSTFIPGNGLTSIAIDPTAQTLLISGNVAVGQFSVATVQTPILPIPYQTLLRIPLDGSSILSSTLLSPGTQSIASPGPSGTAWVAGDLTLPLLPTPPLSTIGNSYAAHLTAKSLVDQTARFGGLPTTYPSFASAPVSLTALTLDPLGAPTFVGAVTPQADISLIPTQTYDLPLFGSPVALLPSTLRDAIPDRASCVFTLCPGSAAYFVRLSNSSTPSLALSTDATPNLTLRNLGAAAAQGLTITSTTFTLTTNCPTTLPAGSECSIALTGGGPGSITLQATNASTQSVVLPAFTVTLAPVVVSPKELDFGIQTSTSVPATRTLTISNLGTQPQAFVSKLDTSNRTLPYILTESSSDCTLTGPTTRLLAAGATCHITLALTASSTPGNDTLLKAQWLVGPQDIFITGYTQAAALSLSAAEIDFGTQYSGGLRLPRYIYLSNNSDTATTHTPISSIAPFTIADHCPTQIPAHTVCQLQIDYLPSLTPANDSATLSLDQGLTALLTGQSLPRTGTTGTTVNPNLTVSPNAVTFPNAVVVTTPSSSTQTVTVGNSGSTPLPLTLNVSGEFSYVTNCPATLPAATICSAIVTFAPAQPGTRQGILSVTSGTTAPIYVNLSGVGSPILAANNGTLDLGSVTVGQPTVQWFKITQPFNSFTASASSDFTAVLVEDIGYGHGQVSTSAFTATASGSCINCWLGLQFSPSAAGPRTGTLSLASNISGSPYVLALTGTGLPQIGLILSPSAADFGTVPLNSVSAPILFTLTNLTPSAIALTSSSITGDFMVSSTPTGGAPCTGTLAMNASCFIQIVFSPKSTPGQQTGTLTLAASAGTVSANLIGYASVDPGVALNPTAVVFHNLPGPTSTTQTVTVTNTGDTTLQIAAPTVTTSSFLATSSCTTLAPAATCTVTVIFTPSDAAVTDTLTLPVTSTTGTTNYSIPLTGAYTTAEAGLQILPAQADFGPNPTSTLGLTRQFTINNLTAKSVSLDVILPRHFALVGAPCNGLVANASCNFSVAFIPLTNGQITGTLTAQAKPADGSATTNAIGYLQGYGTSTNTLTITGPLSPGNVLNFGQVASGQPLSKTLTLTNKGTGTTSTLTIRRITSRWLFLSTSTCGTTLPQNQSCTVTIAYSPLNQLAVGSNSSIATPDAGTLVIESDAASSSDVIALAGVAAPSLVAVPTNTVPLVAFTASRNSLTFPSTVLGTTSTPRTITLSNTGTATLHVLSLATTPDFSFTSTCATLLPGSACDLVVSFTPQATGQRISALQIHSDSSSSLDFISLLGTAAPSLLTLTPTTLDFGTILLGATATLPLKINNTGDTPATIQTLAVSGDYTLGSGTCPAAGTDLAASTSCTIPITFTPTRIGNRPAIFTLTPAGSTVPLAAALAGVGSQAALQLSTLTLDFGSIVLNTSATLTATLTNIGNAPLNAINITLPAGDFAITTPCLATTLLPEASCTLAITFTPTAIGIRTTTLTVSSSAPTSPDRIVLTGTGSIKNVAGGFTFTVDGGVTSTYTVRTGQPAIYALVLTPTDGYTGNIVLNCTPVNPANDASCSIAPSSVSLDSSPQSSVATIQTVTAIRVAQSIPAAHPTSRSTGLGSTILCLLTPALWLFSRKSRLTFNLGALLVTAAALSALLFSNGCGGGPDPSLRFSLPGTYQYRITASSTTGTAIAQSVTLNLVIQSRN